MSQNSILRALPTSAAYGVQVSGGTHYQWVTSKREAARIAWAYSSDGWPTKVKNQDGIVIWEHAR